VAFDCPSFTQEASVAPRVGAWRATKQGLILHLLFHAHALIGRRVLAVLLLVVGLLGTAAFYLRAAPPSRSCSALDAERRSDTTTRRVWIPQIALSLLTPLVLTAGAGAAQAVVSAFLPTSLCTERPKVSHTLVLASSLPPQLPPTGPSPPGHQEGSGVREVPEPMHLLLPQAQGRRGQDAYGLPARV